MDTTTTLIASIVAGQFDNDLDALAKTIEDRRKSLRKGRNLGDFSVGDRVKFNELTGTRYMVGQYATVISFSSNYSIRPYLPWLLSDTMCFQL